MLKLIYILSFGSEGPANVVGLDNRGILLDSQRRKEIFSPRPPQRICCALKLVLMNTKIRFPGKKATGLFS
jgi:hypothetical protein